MDYQFVVGSANGDLTTVRRLLRLQPSLATAEHAGQSALHWAARYGQTAVVSILQQNGAHVDGIGLGGKTPIMWAAYYGHTDTVQCLLSLGGKVDCQDTMGRTALYYACQHGYLDCVITLLNGNASKYLHAVQGYFPLHAAADRNSPAMVKILLEYGCPVNMVSTNIGPGGLRAPPEVAFAMHSWPLLLPTFGQLRVSLRQAVSEQSTRSATLTVVVTHPGTNAHNFFLTSNSDLTTM